MTDKLFCSPLFNVLAFSVFWAVQIFVSKLAFNAGAEVVPFTVQSFAVALMLLGGYVLAFKRNELRHIPRAAWPILVIASAVHGGLGGFFSNAGVALTSAVNAGFLMQFTTVTTTVLAWAWLKEKLTVSKLISVAVIVVGTFLLVTKGHFDPPQAGDILVILACLSWSAGNVLTRKVLKIHSIDSDVVSLFRPLAALPVMLVFIGLAPLYPVAVQPTFQTNVGHFELLGYVFLNALFAVLLWVFLNRTLKIASASYMTMMSAVAPVIVAILALVFLHESLVPIQWVGVLLILASGYVTQWLKIDRH